MTTVYDFTVKDMDGKEGQSGRIQRKSIAHRQYGDRMRFYLIISRWRICIKI